MEKRNLYQEVTDRVLNELSNGVISWAKPWRGGVAVSHTTGGAYTFLNQMLISFSGQSVVAGEYLTFKQVKKEGGNVRRVRNPLSLCSTAKTIKPRSETMMAKSV